MRIFSLAFFFLIFPVFLVTADEIRSEGIVIKFDKSYKNLAEEAARILSRANKTINSKTGLALYSEVTVLLPTSDAEFRAEYKRVTAEEPREEMLAVAFPQLSRILIRRTSLVPIGSGNLPETLTHEMLHIFLSQFARQHNVNIPLWLNEGLAQWVSERTITELDRQYLANSARSNILLPLKELEVKFPSTPGQSRLAYLESYEFLSYLVKMRGEESLRNLFAQSARLGGFEGAFTEVFGKSVEELEKEWTQQLAQSHSFWSQFWRQVTIWELLSLLAVVAFVRYIVRSRRLKRKFEEEEEEKSSNWTQPSEPREVDKDQTAQ
jgi:hypothetical protein